MELFGFVSLVRSPGRGRQCEVGPEQWVVVMLRHWRAGDDDVVLSALVRLKTILINGLQANQLQFNS